MTVFEAKRAIDRLREMQTKAVALPDGTTRKLSPEILRDLELFWIDTIFDENSGDFNEYERQQVKDYYVDSLKNAPPISA